MAEHKKETDTMSRALEYAAWLKKTLIAVVGVLAFLLSTNLVPDQYVGWINGAIAVLATFGIYKAENADKPL